MRLTLWLALAAVAVALPASADTIRLESDLWCPHVCQPDSERPGYMVEIARAALQSKGHRVEVTLSPWARAVSNALEGRADGVIGAAESEARGLVLAPEPIGRAGDVFVVRAADPWAYGGMDSLRGRVLGTLRGYSFGAAMDAWIEGHRDQVQEMGGEAPLDSNLRKLMAGRIDIAMDNEAVVTFALARPEYHQHIRVAGTVPGTHLDLFVAFTPKAPRLSQWTADLAEGIATLRSDGRLGRIMDRYGLRDWKMKTAATPGW